METMRLAADGDAPLVNFPALLKYLDGDFDLLKEIFRLFQESSPKKLTELNSAFHQKDALAVQRTAHALKGAIANFFSPACLESAVRLEACAATRDWEAMRREYRIFENLIREFEYYVADYLTTQAATA